MPHLVVPCHRDLSAACAEAVLADFHNDLPDLRRAVILLPEASHHIKPQFVELRNHLLKGARERGHDALIAPLISTPRQLFRQRHPHAAKMPTPHELKLLLADNLEKHPGLFPATNVWQLAGELLHFFDEISELDEAREAGGKLLEHGLTHLDHQIWSDETKMLLTMWHGWCGLFNTDGDAPGHPMDAGAAYRGELLRGGLLEDGEHGYLCGNDRLTPCQTVWARKLHDEGRLTILTNLNGQTTTPRYPNPAAAMLEDITGAAPATVDGNDDGTDLSALLDQIFSAENTPLATRADAIAKRLATSPLAQRLRIFRPRTLEEHAGGVYLAVRQWLAEDKTVGIVSLDRRLTRRLRAVFERHQLSLYDTSGWELSTTSSAGALHNLLLAADHECAAHEILALMRSPWCKVAGAHPHAAAARIEGAMSKADCPPQTTRDWISQLRTGLGSKDNAPTLAQHIADAINGLREPAASSSERRPFTEYYEHLRASLDSLGMAQKFSADPAGARILKELKETHQAAAKQQTRGTFRTWRNWLAHNLESANFMPPVPENGVVLMNLHQSRLAQFDALAIVSLDKRHLPTAPQPGLVNEKIRHELGLETREQREAFQFHLFRRLLESTGTVLLSCQQHAGNRALEPSPWLSAITGFHHSAYGSDLDDPQLARRAGSIAHPLNATAGHAVQLQTRPAPHAPREAWPEQFSAAAHKTLVECPYRFFVRYGLHIREQRDNDNYWGSAQYGTHLHQCLQALNADLPHLPGPMKKPWTEAHLEYALSLAREIIDAEFSQAVAANYANRYWHTRALADVEYYVRWMIQRFGHEPTLSLDAEHQVDKTLDGGWTISGRLDLMANAPSGKQVVDYKSGKLQARKNILQGEDVQLSSYALLVEDAHTALYLGLSKQKSFELSGDELDTCRDQARERLLAMHRDFMDGAPLPAWGDEKTACQHCSYQGLCRRPVWQAYPTDDTDTPPTEPEQSAKPRPSKKPAQPAKA